MKKLKEAISAILLSVLVIVSPVWSGTTGKIAGTVIDKTTSETLPGVNVIVMGTSLGASTDISGQYTILEVPPGTYKLRISMIGYTQVLVEDVIVNIDQTARVDVSLQPQAVQAGEVVVTAEHRLIKPDVATSITTVTAQQAEQLPAVNAMSVLGLQAGIQGGFSGPLGYGGGISIRGVGGDQILFNVDGTTLRDPRNNDPEERISLSDVKEISVERGGFNAEYGQVRGGVVNVVTREGDKGVYSGRFQLRVAPPQPKYWLAPGVYDLNNPMSFALRPAYDPAVCWTGTLNGNWDYYTRQEYPSFVGWDQISQQLNASGYDLTPVEAQREFEYETRKAQPNNQPDYDIDAGFGGPVPVVSDALGNLRFFASYRSNRTMLLWPMSRPDYRDYDGTFQLNSDITPTMKLQINGLYAQTLTERSNWDGGGASSFNYFYPQSPSDVLNVLGTVDDESYLFNYYSDYSFSLTDIRNWNVSAKFTHTLGADTYYEVLLQRYTVRYNTGLAAQRDTSSKVEVLPGLFEDSFPFGFSSPSIGLFLSSTLYSRARDNSFVTTQSAKFDLTSQINFENLVKAGIEFDYNDLNFDYGIINTQAGPNVYGSRTQLQVFPYRGAAYVQDKLETKEFTMNAGLRLDLADANTHWWDVNPFNGVFFNPPDSATLANTNLPTTPSKMELDLEPRLGISHPISENAKLFFNYGWFRELPIYESMFRLSRSQLDVMSSFGNPNLILAKTVSYELGVDYALGDEYLFSAAAYYNDVTNQQDVVNYISTSGFSYQESSANSYADNKGVELTLRKASGDWVNGFVNYTYQVNTGGHFGESNLYDNLLQQTIYNDNTTNLYQNRPIPAPFARANVNFMTPSDLGPQVVGNHILGAWMLNVVLDWQAGYWITWNPNNILNIASNVQVTDYFNAYLRLQKTVSFGRASLQLFMDMNNIFNNKSNDFRYLAGGTQSYMESLHLPVSSAYNNIPGNDKVGDYRKPGVAWQPIEEQGVLDPNTAEPTPDKMNGANSIAIFYEISTGKYWWYGPHGYSNGQAGWWQVPSDRMNEVLADKAYIQMPQESTFWFLDPRTFYFGLTFSFNLSD